MNLWRVSIKTGLTLVFIFFIAAIFLFAGNFFKEKAFAGIYMDPHPDCGGATPACWENISINEWSCLACNDWEWKCIQDWDYVASCGNDNNKCKWYACSGDIDTRCSGPGDNAPCQPYLGTCQEWSVRYKGDCKNVCVDGWETDPCFVYDTNAACNMNSPTVCGWSGLSWQCSWSLGECTVSSTPDTRGCCGPGGPTPTSPPPTPPPPTNTPTPTPTPATATIEGKVFNDPGGDAVLSGGMCNLAGASGVQPGTGSSATAVSLANNYTASIDGSGNFTISGVLPDTYRIGINPDVAEGWVCTCPAPGCSYSRVVPGDTNGLVQRYYVSQVQEAWAQTVGGDVHAGLEAGPTADIVIPIPVTCLGACVPEFSVVNPVTGDEVGVVSATGTTSYAPGGTVSAPGWEAVSGYDGPVLLFNFWRGKSDALSTLADLDGAPPSGIYEILSTTDLTLNGNWNNISQQTTIFVNFTSDPANRWLTIDPAACPPSGDKCIDVNLANPNAVLTIITNGNLQVADTVKRIEGVYLVDGVFRSCVNNECGYDYGSGAEYQLRVNGSVIAWTGIDLQRDLYLSNRNTPGELFTYVPQFIPRLADFMLQAIYSWGEVAP